MTDAPPTPKNLVCLICGTCFSKNAGLTWHRLAKHKTVAWQPRSWQSKIGTPAADHGAGWGGCPGAGSAPPLPPPPPSSLLLSNSPSPPPASSPPAPPPPALGGAQAEANGGDEAGPLGGLAPSGGGVPPAAALTPDGGTAANTVAPPSTNKFTFGESAIADTVAGMDQIIEMTRKLRADGDGGQARKRAKQVKGRLIPTATKYDYATLSEAVQQLDEELHY